MEEHAVGNGKVEMVQRWCQDGDVMVTVMVWPVP